MARRKAMSKGDWDNGLKIEVSVTPHDDGEETAEIAKSTDSKTSEAKEQAVSTFRVSKSLNEELREITCVAMVAEEVDAHGDFFTIEAVKGASEGFLANYNISKSLGLDHEDGADPKSDLIGSMFFSEAGTIDNLDYPANSWVVKMKIHGDDVWESITKSERTGLSIEGPAKGFELEEETDE